MLLIIKYLHRKSRILIPMVLQHSKDHTGTSPTWYPKVSKRSSGTLNRGAVCPDLDITKGAGKDEGGGKGLGKPLKRAITPGKCRLGFIPEEWFIFLKPMTGVSGPYLLMLGLGNYAASKEILVMEHEYYLGISVFIVIYLVTTRFGTTIGSALDAEVDAIANELQDSRQKEVDSLKKHVFEAQTAIWRAQAQSELMDAKKENIAIQLEAVYRERQMVVYNGVRRRMEYHVKQHYVHKRLRHKWMVQWILNQVHKGITPEFKKKVMEIAIRDLTALANQYQASAKK